MTIQTVDVDVEIGYQLCLVHIKGSHMTLTSKGFKRIVKNIS